MEGATLWVMARSVMAGSKDPALQAKAKRRGAKCRAGSLDPAESMSKMNHLNQIIERRNQGDGERTIDERGNHD